MSAVFLLSPADMGGERARLVRNPRAAFPLAVRLRGEGAPLGEVMAFVSGLYFRGKHAYARAFGRGYVITATDGLWRSGTKATLADLERFAGGSIHEKDERYAAPLRADVRALARRVPPRTPIVLLGSIASRKYTAILEDELGARLLFPPDFLGRGDMSRGGLMLRCAESGVELRYAPILGSPRHGVRPPRLPPRLA